MNDVDKIKQTLTITIVSENGSKQLTSTKAIQKVIVYCGVILFIAVILGYFAMSYFIKQLDDINTTKQESYMAFQNVYQQNMFLKNDIQKKIEELQAMHNRIDDLEKVVNFDSNDKKNNIDMNDLEKLNDKQKATILQIIPNGNPLAIFEMKQKAKKNTRDYGLIDMQYSALQTYNTNIGYDYYTSKSEPVYATADGLVESMRDDNQKYGYGNIVRLSHIFGFSSAYTNLDKIAVKVGDFVNKGDIIGYTTPSKDREHISLYYEVRFLSQGLDTLSFIDWDTKNFQSIFNTEKNENIDMNSLILALDNIVRLNDISTHFTYSNEIKHTKDSLTSKLQSFNLLTPQKYTKILQGNM